MGNFVESILVPQIGLLDFNFVEISTPAGRKYYVTVLYQEKAELFNMELKSGKWKIVDAPQVPSWIHSVEKELSIAILNH